MRTAKIISSLTEEERKEASKYFRVSIQFMWWIFIIYGNWGWMILSMPKNKYNFGFHVYDFNPFKPKRSIDI